MRYIHYLLFCFTLLFVQGAHAFYCIETINGTAYPTLYTVSGETWADVEKREGCTFIEYKSKISDRNFSVFIPAVQLPFPNHLIQGEIPPSCLRWFCLYFYQKSSGSRIFFPSGWQNHKWL